MKRLYFTRALTGGIFSALSAPVTAQPAPLTEIRLGTNASDDVTPLLWAQTSGMFARAGLKINLQRFSSGSVATAAVIGGALDAARVSVLPLIIARSRGIPLQIIAPAELSVAGNATEGIVTLKDSSIASGRDLKGAIMPVPALHASMNSRPARGSTRRAATPRR